MCKTKSGIILENGTVYDLRDSDKHEDIVDANHIQDAESSRDHLTFARWECVPPDGNIWAPIEKWDFQIDEFIRPLWFGESHLQACLDRVKAWAAEVLITKNREIGDGRYWVRDCCVTVKGTSKVHLYSGSAKVLDSATIVLFGSSKAELNGRSHAALHDESRAILTDRTSAALYGESKADLYKKSFADAHEVSQVNLFDDASAVLYNESRGFLYDKSHALLFGDSRVEQRASSFAELFDDSKSTLYGFSVALRHSSDRGTPEVRLHERAILIDRNNEDLNRMTVSVLAKSGINLETIRE